MRTPTRAYAAMLALLLLPLAACGSTDKSPVATADPTPTASASASGSSDWNPCSDLDAAPVGAALGAEVTKETGSEDTPRCAFLPVAKGGPTLNVSYLWYDGGFEEAWASMGQIDGTVSDLDIRHADAARLVVNATRKAVLVTGFVQTGGLIENVNAIQLAPYDRAAMADATTRVMRTLVAHAPTSPDAAGQPR